MRLAVVAAAAITPAKIVASRHFQVLAAFVNAVPHPATATTLVELVMAELLEEVTIPVGEMLVE